MRKLFIQLLESLLSQIRSGSRAIPRTELDPSSEEPLASDAESTSAGPGVMSLLLQRLGLSGVLPQSNARINPNSGRAANLTSNRSSLAGPDGRKEIYWSELHGRAVEDLIKPLEPPPHIDPIQWSLDRARRQLVGTELLLVEPTPEAISQARILLEEVTRDVVRLQRLVLDLEAKDRSPYASPLLEFQKQLGRVARLLQGARRMQWARIRWVGALVQTYNSAGKARLWCPAAKTWTLEM